MAVDEHLYNPLEAPAHRPVETSDGGQCLARHEYKFEEVSRPEGRVNVLKPGSCNHRWQAFNAALDHSGDYNGQRGGRRPWYRPFIDAKRQRKYERVVLFYSGGRMVRRQITSRCPADGDWDVSAKGLNYRSSCNRPFWHEAHHMIPNGAPSGSGSRTSGRALRTRRRSR